jgi:hypothetical protein
MPEQIEIKRCARCGETKPLDRFSPYARNSDKRASYCKACNSLASMEYVQRNREKVAAYQRGWGEANRERLVARRKQQHIALRIETLNAYGGVRCACCGVTDLIFLALDHIADDGPARQKAGEHRAGVRLYKALKDAGFPPGFQVLCFNCNWAKSHGGCPHWKASADEDSFGLFELVEMGL